MSDGISFLGPAALALLLSLGGISPSVIKSRVAKRSFGLLLLIGSGLYLVSFLALWAAFNGLSLGVFVPLLVVLVVSVLGANAVLRHGLHDSSGDGDGS